MAEARQTTIRFSEPMYRRLEFAGQVTGLPINSIVVIACLEWLDAHQPSMPQMGPLTQAQLFQHWGSPFGWRRASYPFDRFTELAKRVLTMAQSEAEGSGQSYIRDEHLLIGLLEVGDGLAPTALANLGLNIDKIRSQLGAVSKPPPGLMKRLVTPASNIKRIIERAFHLAQEAGKASVGTGDLLTALVVEPDATAVRALSALGVSADQVRSEIGRLAAETGAAD